MFLVCYGAYLFTTRHPDFLDGEYAPGTIVFKQNESGKQIPFVSYHTGYATYEISALYVFRNYQPGEKVTVIYEAAQPAKGVVYHWWGYWITWQELMGGILLIIVLFQLAKAITQNPTPEALLEQMEYKEERKKKYIE